jgi:hypothetical protein
MSKRIGGNANSFQRDYLEANLKGTNFRGSTVTSVSNKYIHTKEGSHLKAGTIISFIPKEGTENMIRPDTSGDTEGDRL